MSAPVRTLLALAALAAMLTACGGDGSVAWRGLTVEVPEGWTVFEEADTRLSIASAPLGEQADPEQPPEGDVVAMFFQHERDARPGEWRDYVDDLDEATLETDDSLTIDGDTPATRLVFSHTTNGIPTREMVVVIPARDVVVLSQPVARAGDEDAPEVFLDHIDTFLEVIEGLEVGAPVELPGQDQPSE